MESQTLFARSRILCLLVAAGAFAIPFDSVPGPSALGELANELSFPVFALAIGAALAICLATCQDRLSSSLALRIGAGIIVVVFLSWVVNAFHIHGAYIRGRSGENKFFTSLFVLIYGIMLAWLAEQLEEGEVWRLLMRPIVWSAVFCSLYALFELAGRTGPISVIFDPIDKVLHARQTDVVNAWNGSINYKVLYDWDPRLRSVSFEPPAFGNYCGFAWPWVWFGAVMAPPYRRLRAWGALALFTIVILLAGNRTAVIMLGGEVAALAIVSFVYVRPRLAGEAGAVLRFALPMLLVAGLVAALAYFVSDHSRVVAEVVGGESVSDLSRLGFLTAAMNIFLDHPLLGVGLGQFGFYVGTYLPSWAYFSPEVAPMLYYANGPWPVTYSLYARLAAELGTLGLVGWIGLWSSLAVATVTSARRNALEVRTSRFEYPIVLSCMAVLLSGIASDTFRTPMMWVALGLASAAIRRAHAERSDVSLKHAAVPA